MVKSSINFLPNFFSESFRTKYIYSTVYRAYMNKCENCGINEAQQNSEVCEICSVICQAWGAINDKLGE